MRECFCPEELGGASHFVSVTEYSDWNPTHEHFPRPKRYGGQRTLDNSILAHRLCNRIDYSILVGDEVEDAERRLAELLTRQEVIAVKLSRRAAGEREEG